METSGEKTRYTHWAAGQHSFLENKKGWMDSFSHVIPRFSPRASHFSARDHSANTTSKEKISHILILRGKESKMRILDILLQRNLEYAKSLNVKNRHISRAQYRHGSLCCWIRAYKVFISTANMIFIIIGHPSCFFNIVRDIANIQFQYFHKKEDTKHLMPLAWYAVLMMALCTPIQVIFAETYLRETIRCSPHS